ncbi:S24 family peptidase [Ruegeria sp.]|uniref:S24 family peptidase n=1 Tax=Ruegeria sp. TaxID=1879320 RepID=UPI003AFFF71D
MTNFSDVAIHDEMEYRDIQVALRGAVERRGTNPYRAAIEAGLPGTAIRHALEGHEPKVGRAAEICRALGLEFYIGPPRDGAPVGLPRAPNWSAFTDATLPHRGLATCSVQGWSKSQPLRDPLPRPEDIMDDDAFWVSATGQSMIPEGIDGGCVCLVSPGREVRDGDRVWILDFQGRAAIKRLVEKTETGSLKLRGWLPKRDGEQQSFDEERLPAGIREVYPVMAVFRGKPGTEGAEYIPDPKAPAPAAPPEGSNVAPVERVPKAITDMLGLPEGASADAVLKAMEAKIATRGTAHATPVAALERKVARTLKSETRSLKDELAALLDARLPPAPDEDETRISLPFAGDVRAGPGAGEEVFEESEISLGIPAEALPPGLRPERAIALRAEGHTMEPTIRSGDILVIDHGDREAREGALFVIRTETGLVVRRLKQEGHGGTGEWIMTSDNPEGYPPRPVGPGDHILGRVIWFGPEKAVVVGG